MKIIFFGTPAFALASLEALIESGEHEVLAVCTQPDRPSGRGHKLTPSPVKSFAAERDIPVYQPQTLRFSCPDAKKIRECLASHNADIFVVAAYGLMLPKGVLFMPPRGSVNVHASLLPKYRGASPIHSALLNGDKVTGITIMQMDTGMDTGDIILRKSLEISDGERFPSLHDRMARLGGEALLDALSRIEYGTATRTPQDDSAASHSPLIKKTDGEINWSDPTEKIINQTRAFDPWPGCYATLNGHALKIWRVESVEATSDQPSGAVLSANTTEGLRVKTGDGAVKITELQATGKKRMSAEDYLRGLKQK